MNSAKYVPADGSGFWRGCHDVAQPCGRAQAHLVRMEFERELAVRALDVSLRGARRDAQDVEGVEGPRLEEVGERRSPSLQARPACTPPPQSYERGARGDQQPARGRLEVRSLASKGEQLKDRAAHHAAHWQ